MVHAQHAGFHVAHADGVEELGDAEHGEGVGLAAGEKLRHVKEKPQVVERQRKLARQQQGNGQLQEGGGADKGDEEAIEQRAAKAASRKEAFVPGTGRAAHEAARVVRVHAQGQGRQGVGNQVDPQDVAGLQRGAQAQQDGGQHGNDFPEIRGEQEEDRFFDIFVNAAAFRDGLRDGGEIVVGQNQIGGGFWPRRFP